MVNALKSIFQNRYIIWELSKNDFKTKYLGSYLGILWAFIQPTIAILIYWFVFQVGFKSVPVKDFPFILWFLAGIVPWFFISESVSAAATSIIENNHLVKKVVFKVWTLPVIKIVSSLFVHLFFILVLFLIFFLYGYKPNLYNIQVIYYSICAVFFVLGISWLTSAIIVFFKDTGQIISMIINFLFWLTPIFWTLDIAPQQYHVYFKINPFYYIIEGYRDSLIHKVWFWDHPVLTLYFWVISVVIFVSSIIIFKKLRSHFADVI